MANITEWKINNQTAELRDGTKGQPNGAVPLDAQGKISKSLLKAVADAIPMSATDAKSLATYVSEMVVGALSLPLEYTNIANSLASEPRKILYGEASINSGVFIFTRSQLKILKRDYTLDSVTSFDSNIALNGSAPLWWQQGSGILLATSTGLMAVYGDYGWSTPKIFSGSCESLAVLYNAQGRPTLARCVRYEGVKKLYKCEDVYSDVTAWVVDASWTYDDVHAVFLANGEWFLNGYMVPYGNVLCKFNGTTWEPYTELVSADWKGVLYVAFKDAYIAWSTTEVWVKTSAQSHWWQFTNLPSDATVYNVICSDTQVVVATSKGLYRTNLHDCVPMPQERPVLSLISISADKHCYTIAYGGNMWFVSCRGSILYSFNGIDWYLKSVDSTLYFTDAKLLATGRWLLASEPNPTTPAGQQRAYLKLSNTMCVQGPVYM